MPEKNKSPGIYNQKIRVFSGRSKFSAHGSEGTISVAHNGEFVFIPDDGDDIPPGVSAEDFGGYQLNQLVFCKLGE